MVRIITKLLALAVLALLALSVTVTAEAQPLTVTQFRLTRWTDTAGVLSNPQSFTVAKTALACDLARLPGPRSRGFRFDDMDRPGQDCEYLGDAGGILATQVTTWAWTIAAGTADGIWSGEVRGNVRTVPAPTNPRVMPGVGVEVAGTVLQRFPFAGLDVAMFQVDGGPVLHLGGPALAVPGYSVAVGDRVWLALMRPGR